MEDHILVIADIATLSRHLIGRMPGVATLVRQSA